MRILRSADPARPAGTAGLAALAALAVALAAIEILVGASSDLVAGAAGDRPAAYPRAEAVVFIASRPWLLLLLGLSVSGCRPGRRLALYGLFLLAAAAAEAFYLLSLGNTAPWGDLLRGVLAAALLAGLIDAVLCYVRRSLGGRGLAAAAAAGALLLAAPVFEKGWRVAAAGTEAPRAAARKPDLLLMTALPIVWGEGGAFDPASRPAGAYRLLQEEFSVQPVDTLEPASLGGGRLLLLAQPRWLAPAELVALDQWVRAGGRALVLTDPALEWPSDLPIGDVRRAPPVGLLAPLLDHWGVTLAGPLADGGVFENGRRLVLRRAGHLATNGTACRTVRAYRADCSIGSGRVTIIADADLLRDDLWMAPGSGGETRDRRTADNPLVIADILDALGGHRRERARGAVSWARPESDPLEALRLAVAGLLLLCAILAVAALILRRRAR